MVGNRFGCLRSPACAFLAALVLAGCGVLIPDLPPPRELSRAEAEQIMSARRAAMVEEYKHAVGHIPTSLPLKFGQLYRTKVPLWTFWSNEGVLLTFGRWKLSEHGANKGSKPDYPVGSVFQVTRVLALWGDGAQCHQVYVKFEGASWDYVINVLGERDFFLNPDMFEAVGEPEQGR